MHKDAAMPRATLLVVLSLVAAVAFVVLAAYRIDMPGLYADEVLFAPAALQAAGACEVEAPVSMHAGTCFPLYLAPPYLGALKAWLYAPLFAAFEPTPALVRWPMLVLAALTIVGWLLLAARWLGVPLLVALAALLAFDPAYAIHARLDWGPVVLGGALKVLLLAALLWWLRSGSWRAFLACIALVLVGLYDKLSFAWVAAAFGGAMVAVYGREIAANLRRWRPVQWAAVLCGGAALAYPVALVVANAMRLDLPGADSAASTWERLVGLVPLLDTTLSADFARTWISGSPADPGRWPFWMLALGMLATALLALARPWRDADLRERWRALAFVALSTLLLVGCLAATRQVGGAHHAIVLWPLHWLLWVLAIELGIRLVCRRRAALQFPLMAMAALVLIGGAALPFAQRQLELRALWRGDFGFTERFDPGSIALARRLAQIDARWVIATDWGLHLPQVVLSPAQQRGRLQDWWPVFNAPPTTVPADAAWRIATYLREGPVVFVSFAGGRALMPRTELNREAQLAAWGLCVESTEVLHDAQGRGLFELRIAGSDPERCPTR